jgi:hypothetical protein
MIKQSEPYYCYLWLKKKTKTIYPDVDLPYLHDRITNVVYDLNNQPIIYHTWFAREYGDGRGRHTEKNWQSFWRF